MASRGYMARIGLDTSDIEKNIRNLSRELRAVDRSLETNADSVELNQQRQQILAEEITALTRKLEALRNAESAVNAALSAGTLSTEEYRAYRREIENTEAALRQLQAQDQGTGNASEETAQALANQAAALKDVSDKANTAADTLMNTFVGAVKTVGDKIAGLTQDATALYGEYQQLVGGVQTLFGDNAQAVIDNADKAFINMGISANTYMETATSFAASLVSSLDGDTQKAAKSVDLALQDMSDNANKMGTAMQSIQNAYQGFAKQNYTMLDNLKLGYGGTKKEMERLLEDAQKLTGVKYDISSLDDIINAIHAIQDQIGITGTTADEAAKTITGSASAMKAAWENLLTAMADPNGTHDLEGMVQNFVDTAITSIDNMMPSIEAAILGMGDVIEELSPVIEEKLPQLIDDIIPLLTEAITTLMGAAGQAIIDNLPTILDGIWDALRQILDETDGTARAVVTIITGTWATLKGIGIATDIAHIVTLIGSSEGVVGVLNVLNGTLGGTAAAATTASEGFVALAASIAPLLALGAALTAGAIALSDYIDEEREALNEYADGLNGYTDLENERLERYVRLTRSSTKEAAEAAKEWYESDKEMYDAMADMRQKYLEGGGEVGDAMDQYYTEQINSFERLVLQEEKAIKKGEELSAEEKARADAEFAAAHTREAARQQEIAAMAEMANSGNTTAEAVSKVWENVAAKTKETMDDLDSQLAKHQLTEEKYWEERKEYLEKHRNEDSEEWWAYYDKVTDYYDKKEAADKKAAENEAKAAKKAAEDRKKAAEQAEKDRIDAAKALYESEKRTHKIAVQSGEYDDRERIEQDAKSLETLKAALGENNEDYKKLLSDHLTDKAKVEADITKQETADTKAAIDERFSELERTAKYENWTQEQLLDSKEAALNELAQKDTDLYNTYYGKIADGRAKAAEDARKAEEQQQKNIITAAEKAAEKLTSAYQSRYSELMGAVDKPQQVTDREGNKRLIFSDYRKKLNELKEYQANIGKLKDLGLSSGHLNEIFSMDFDTRALYIKELLNMGAADREQYLKDYEAYSRTSKDVAQQELDFDTKLTEDINKIFEEVDGYANGAKTAAEWLRGFQDALKGSDLEGYELSNIVDPGTIDQAAIWNGLHSVGDVMKAVGENIGITNALKSLPEAFRASVEGISITINIDGEKTVRKTVKQMTKESSNSSSKGVI